MGPLRIRFDGEYRAIRTGIVITARTICRQTDLYLGYGTSTSCLRLISTPAEGR